MRLAAAALDVMSARQQYSGRCGYLAYQAPGWIWQWFGSGRSFEQLLLLQPLLCPRQAAASSDDEQAAASRKAAALQLLDRYGSSIMSSLLQADAEQELQAVAGAAGSSTAALVDRWCWQVTATLYPALTRSLKADAAAAKANEVAERMNLKSKLITHSGKRALLNGLFSMALPSTVTGTTPQQQQQKQRQQLRRWFEQAASRQAGCLFYPQPLVVDTVKLFAKGVAAGKFSPEEQKGMTEMQKAMMTPRSLQQVLLNMHRNIAAAADPMHKLQRLGQLEALMHLLHRDEAASPVLARYLVSMLLQLVHVPALQSYCCMLLQIFLHDILYAAAGPDGGLSSAAKAGSKESKAAVKAEQEQQLQQQRLAVRLLEELLPPTVASLVRCVERAAAAKQLQQQLLLWSGPVTSLQLPSLAGYSSGGAADSAAAAASAVDLPTGLAPVALLLALLLRPPQALLHVVQTLDLLPPLPVLAGPVALQQRLRQGLRLPQQVVQFEQRAAGMAPSSRQRLIQAITAQLQCAAAELYVDGASAGSSAVAAGGVSAGDIVSSSKGASSPDNPGTGSTAGAAAATAAAESMAAGSIQRCRVDPAVVAAAFKLAKLGAQLGDRGVTELAGQLLALAGPVDPHIITFDAAAADGESSSSNIAGSKGLVECTAFPMRAVLQHLVQCMFDTQPHVVAVAQATLHRLLATPEAAAELRRLQEDASKTAGAAGAAATEQRHSSSSYCSSSDASAALLCSYLSVFVEKPSQSTSQLEVDREAAVQALAAATSPALWSPVCKPFNSWLCDLCSTLLTAVSATEAAESNSRLLQLLADAAALQPSLSELLLPHALLALCTSDSSGADLPGIGSVGLSARLGAAITEGLQLDCSSSSRSLSPLPGGSTFGGGNDNSSSSSGSCDSGGGYTGADVDVRCLSVLLGCLDHARMVHRMAMLAPPGASQPPPAAAWQRCYCVHISYLAVAAAAMSCKAYFTALLYIEHWCEEQYGKLTLNPAAADAEAAGRVQLQHLQQLQQLAGLGGAPAVQQHHLVGGATAGQQQEQLLEAMLLDLYSNVNEPDGIYAVAAAYSSPASQLHLLQHEQLWAGVLGAEDALLQASAVQSQQLQRLGHGNIGILMALQHLGCQATAQQCLTAAAAAAAGGAAVMQPSGVVGSCAQQQQRQQQLLDMQCELAWRLSDWGVADCLAADAAAAAGSGGGGGIHGLAAPAAAAAKATDAYAQPSFNAAVLSALQALQHKDLEGFTASVSGARHECVLQLARSSTQSAAAVNPLLVQLRMLHMLQQGLGWARKEAARQRNTPAAAGGARSGSGGVGLEPIAAVPAEADAEQLLRHVLGADFLPGGGSAVAEHLRTARFQLADQLLSLQAAVAKVLRRPDALALTLQVQARTARRAGLANHALAALSQLQQLLQQACAAAGGGAGWPMQLAVGGGGGDGAAGQVRQRQRQHLRGWLQELVAADAPWLLESVQLKWQQGQQLPAFRELQALVGALQTQQQQQQQQQQQGQQAGSHAQQLPVALMRAQALAGQWMAAGQFSSSRESALSAFKSAAAIAQLQQQDAAAGAQHAPAGLSRLHCRVYFQLASYADQRFKEIEAQMASPEWQKQKQVLEYKDAVWRAILQRAAELRRLPPAKQGSQAVQAEIRQLNKNAGMQRQVINDREIVQQVEANRAACLRTALGSYRLCIATGNTHDLQVVYRLCGLWFKLSSDPSVNGALGDVFASTPSARFVPLVYQMASRLDSTEGSFQAVLKTALSRLMREHPYHTLYSLIALRNGDVDGDSQVKSDQGKVAAAAGLLEELRSRGSPDFQQTIDDMVTQVQVFIEMNSVVKLPRNAQGRVTQKTVALPGSVRRRLLNVRSAPPICMNLPLDPSCQYKDVPYVAEVDSLIDLPGGINVPMVVRTTDSNGAPHKQLVKSGNDDLRQDAVMQQFFGLINDLLSSSPESQQRQLSLRTYRVVPCSPKVGVVQWVERTQPVGDYLSEGAMKEGGACARYRKAGNMTWLECHQRMHSSQPEQLKDNLLYCMAHFPPVFHNFFLERFPQPAAWFAARTAYTRSTAVNSMAGAVIGLGDRHLNNVLVDLATAEVLHIDLGIAFEQGMFLSTPERVPFRLTANVVDGMGAAGLEGTFRRCCETTLQALRSHKEALLTVVEVVLHDPMYKWQMTPVKAQRRQQDPLAADGGGAGAAAPAGTAGGAAASGGGASSAGPAGSGAAAIGNADAERAVLRVKQKLEGQDVEGGVAMSVAAQVGKWLQDAQDPDRLCRMFVGWAAWQ
ncbi:hypothetical protein COO60DRAFT_542235 [Scenedesmus sp. NREL 46B-D3]|nr:hypothetical protein COO60DRAFT_542235 [Scenedesmus sp. NREL 46B-D3]